MASVGSDAILAASAGQFLAGASGGMASIGVINTVILLGALLVLAGIFSSLIASRFGAPLLLVFLVIGMLAGENGPGGIAFDDFRLTYLAGSLALAVILF